MRTMRKAILLMGLVLSLASNAQPTNWEPVAISEDHSAWLFLDYASIEHRKGKTTARVMLEYADDQPGTADTQYQDYIAIRSLVQFDCTLRRQLMLEEEYLDSDEGFLGGGDLTSEQWRPVIPESLMESAYDIVCSKGPPLHLTAEDLQD